ncbi:MAG TPA: hypothetical protein VEA69_03275 [Tepidisphaeraceae bacterium]|nr:hypothetical protein [Tepidisphaeraceae bacterium]
MSRMFAAVALVLVACLSFAVPAALASKCAPPPPPAEAMGKCDAVFLGKVTAVERGDRSIRVTIAVEKSWKGDAKAELVVSTGMDGGDCGYGFQQGKSYVVYAYARDKGLSTGTCSRTCHVDEAGEDLKALGEGKKPAAEK